MQSALEIFWSTTPLGHWLLPGPSIQWSVVTQSPAARIPGRVARISSSTAISPCAHPRRAPAAWRPALCPGGPRRRPAPRSTVRVRGSPGSGSVHVLRRGGLPGDPGDDRGSVHAHAVGFQRPSGVKGPPIAAQVLESRGHHPASRDRPRRTSARCCHHAGAKGRVTAIHEGVVEHGGAGKGGYGARSIFRLSTANIRACMIQTTGTYERTR